MSTGPADLLTIGRSGVDIYPLEVGVPLDEVSRFAKFLGGSATNVAVAAARLGNDVGVITRVGADPFGRFVRSAIAGFGVSIDQVLVATSRPDLPTPVTFCEIFPPDDFPLYFYRQPSAPDLQILPGELDLGAIAATRIYWSTVTGLCQEPSRGSHHVAWEARAGAAAPERRTVLDLDYRPMFWPDAATAHAEIARALPFIDTVVGNLTECSVAVTGEAQVTLSPDALADALLELGVRLAVVKMGPDGVLAATPDERVVSHPVSIEVVNGLGAGDAFGGALCHGLLHGHDLRRTLDFANSAGAYVAGQLACADAMPTEADIDALLASR
ncbi:MAG: 5-dehydro-2-deoxygluconokinase [Actinomycetales bacterium]|nr:5-dehydro-2-deoxygluconokinase [Actinomycetales bacterium]